MEELKLLKAWIKSTWAPAVAVLASPEADEACWRCAGLTVAELLHPFGNLRQLNEGRGGMSRLYWALIASCHYVRMCLTRDARSLQSPSGRLRSSQFAFTPGPFDFLTAMTWYSRASKPQTSILPRS